MTDIAAPNRSWSDSMRAFLHPRAIAMLFLGFSAGVPILLIFSSLSLWLSEAGLSKSAVTMFSWAALGYSFKFIWAPLIDRLPVPVLTRAIGRRRAWIFVSQLAIIGAIVLMALTDPTAGEWMMWWMALGAVLLGFSSATQDIVIDAYRIESADKELQAMLSATYIAGYRIGMVVAGAGALFIADYYGSTKEAYSYEAWRIAYLAMAGAMTLGLLTTIIIREPEASEGARGDYETSDYLRFLLLFALAVAGFILVRFLTSKDGWGTAISTPLYSGLEGMKASLVEQTGNKTLASTIIGTLRLFAALAVAGLIGYFGMKGGIANRRMVSESYVEPVRDFFRRYGMGLALLLLALVGLYRISDIVLGVISNVFYQDVGFTKSEIASISKVFGVWIGIAGGILGGIFAMRVGVLKILFLGAVLSMGTNLLFVFLAEADMAAFRNHNYTIPWIEFGSSNSAVPIAILKSSLTFDLAQFSLFAVIGLDNLAAGLASAAFVAFLSSLTNISFTAVQYAIFSSLMTLLPKIIGGYSGTIVEQSSYSHFFMLTFLMGIPVLLLIWIAGRKLDLKLPEPQS